MRQVPDLLVTERATLPLLELRVQYPLLLYRCQVQESLVKSSRVYSALFTQVNTGNALEPGFDELRAREDAVLLACSCLLPSIVHLCEERQARLKI